MSLLLFVRPIFQRKQRAVLVLSALVCAQEMLAFDTFDVAWPSGDIRVELQLHVSPAPSIPGVLSDGRASWNAVAQDACTEWNQHLVRSKLAPVLDSNAPRGDENGRTNIFFARDIYGSAFGERVLAVTLPRLTGLNRVGEADIIVNASKDWDSYRGALRSPRTDFRRVLVHELGHLLGLDHPDEAIPPQTVTAIMNSSVSSTDTLQADDIAGARALYGTTLPQLQVARGPSTQTVNVGDRVLLEAQFSGGAAPAAGPTLKYTWLFTPVGGQLEPLITLDEPTLLLGAAQVADSGRYSLVVDTPDRTVDAGEAVVTVRPVATSVQTRLVNLSTRGIAGTGDRSMIVGFIVGGERSRRVLIRAAGPTLRGEPFNLSGAIGDPSISVRNTAGAEVGTNQDWGTQQGAGALSEAAMDQLFARVGAFRFGAQSRDAAVVLTLPPGSYTAVVTNAQGTEGVALVEAYDADEDQSQGSRLQNLSTRGFVGSGANILIAGMVIGGPAPRTYLIRVVGDTLSSFSVSGTLDDPTLTLNRGSERLRYLDDWDSPEAFQPAIRAANGLVGAFALTDRQESALLMTLAPGAYTMQVAGLDDTTGVALVEVYEVPEAAQLRSLFESGP